MTESSGLIKRQLSMKKMNNRQLSAVLTAHELGGLRVVGAFYSNKSVGYPGCLAQVALNWNSNSSEMFNRYLFSVKWVSWFDINYRTSWSTDQFLSELEQQGIA